MRASKPVLICELGSSTHPRRPFGSKAVSLRCFTPRSALLWTIPDQPNPHTAQMRGSPRLATIRFCYSTTVHGRGQAWAPKKPRLSLPVRNQSATSAY